MSSVSGCSLEDRRGYLTLVVTAQREGKLLLRRTEGIREWQVGRRGRGRGRSRRRARSRVLVSLLAGGSVLPAGGAGGGLHGLHQGLLEQEAVQ